jgi:hypothetical protein
MREHFDVGMYVRLLVDAALWLGFVSPVRARGETRGGGGGFGVCVCVCVCVRTQIVLEVSTRAWVRCSADGKKAVWGWGAWVGGGMKAEAADGDGCVSLDKDRSKLLTLDCIGVGVGGWVQRHGRRCCCWEA